MSDQPTPEQQLGELAARALDGINGRPIVGAVLLLAVKHDEDTSHSAWFAPLEQPWQMTLGMVEDWRVTQTALITASAVSPVDGDDET